MFALRADPMRDRHFISSLMQPHAQASSAARPDYRFFSRGAFSAFIGDGGARTCPPITQGYPPASLGFTDAPRIIGKHYATFPEKLIAPMILAGCPKGGLVLDCFAGSGTTGAVAQRVGRRFILLDLAYQEIHRRRLAA